MTEAVVRRCSVKKVFLEISQNSQENTCARNFSFLYMFCIVVIDKQRHWFGRKNWVVSKPKRECFVSATSSGKRTPESKISLKHARNQLKVMLILVITQLTREECPFRSSHQRCSVKTDVLKNLANFTGKHLCWSLFWQKQPLEVFCRKGVLEIFLNFTGKHLS